MMAVTMTNLVVETHTIEFGDFCNIFRCEVGPGKRYYKRMPMAYNSYMQGLSPSAMDLTTHEEVGVRIDMASSDFEKLINASNDGLSHQKFRNMHPVARELYDQYMTMYHLTKDQER